MDAWIVFASLGMGALAGAFMFAALYGSRHYLRRTYQWQRWSEDLERDAVDLIHAELLVAECQARLGARVGKMPEDFDRVAFKALGLGAALERAVYAEADRRGLVGTIGATEPPPSMPISDRDLKPANGPLPFTIVAGQIVPVSKP